MNEFDASYKILEEWKTIKRTKRLIQELYEQVGGNLDLQNLFTYS